MKVTAGNVGFVLDQRPAGRREIRVQTPAGGSSTSIASSDGWSQVVRTHEMGREGDPRVVRDLLQALRAAGYAIEQLEAHDDRGEDGKFRLGADEYVVQVVSVPLDPDLWRTAKRKTGRLDQAPEEAIGALRNAIVFKCRKTPQRDRKRIIIALDAVHSGTLEDQIPAYLAQHGDPAQEFGVASVWFVGPSELIVKRIGGGAP